jgi:hypothetical protein
VTRSIAVDFDHVIHSYHDGWHDGRIYGTPMPGAFDAIRALQAQGYAVFIHTSREDVATVAEWILEHSGIATHFVSDQSTLPPFWDNTGIVLVTNRKLGAVAYIDDRAIRFTTWPQALSDLSQYEQAEQASNG